jgi:hypothetical protein
MRSSFGAGAFSNVLIIALPTHKVKSMAEIVDRRIQ